MNREEIRRLVRNPITLHTVVYTCICASREYPTFYPLPRLLHKIFKSPFLNADPLQLLESALQLKQRASVTLAAAGVSTTTLNTRRRPDQLRSYLFPHKVDFPHPPHEI